MAYRGYVGNSIVGVAGLFVGIFVIVGTLFCNYVPWGFNGFQFIARGNVAIACGHPFAVLTMGNYQLIGWEWVCWEGYFYNFF